MVSLRAELSLCGDPIFAADSIVLTTADVSRGEPNWALMGETRLATRLATLFEFALHAPSRSSLPSTTISPASSPLPLFRSSSACVNSHVCSWLG